MIQTSMTLLEIQLLPLGPSLQKKHFSSIQLLNFLNKQSVYLFSIGHLRSWEFLQLIIASFRFTFNWNLNLIENLNLNLILIDIFFDQFVSQFCYLNYPLKFIQKHSPSIFFPQDQWILFVRKIRTVLQVRSFQLQNQEQPNLE